MLDLRHPARSLKLQRGDEAEVDLNHDLEVIEAPDGFHAQ